MRSRSARSLCAPRVFTFLPGLSGRSNKGAVGNCVTTMVHNHYASSKKASPPKSSNQTASSLK